MFSLSRITVGQDRDPAYQRNAHCFAFCGKDHSPDHPDDTQDLLDRHKVWPGIRDQAQQKRHDGGKRQIEDRLVAVKAGKLIVIVHDHRNEKENIADDR